MEASSDRKNNMVASRPSSWHLDLLAGQSCPKVSGRKVRRLAWMNPFACLRVDYHPPRTALNTSQNNSRASVSQLLPPLSQPTSTPELILLLPCDSVFSVAPKLQQALFPLSILLSTNVRGGKGVRANRKLINPSTLMSGDRVNTCLLENNLTWARALDFPEPEWPHSAQVHVIMSLVTKPFFPAFRHFRKMHNC